MNNHGWVYPNADGSKARCGGPGICESCAKDMGRLRFEKAEKESKRAVCDLCQGHAWVRFKEPNALGLNGGSCPKCNAKGDIDGPDCRDLWPELEIRVMYNDPSLDDDSIIPEHPGRAGV